MSTIQVGTAIRERILAGLFAGLQALSADDQREKVFVFRDRGDLLGESQLPAISLNDDGDSDTDNTRSFGLTFATLNATLVLRVQADDENALSTAMNALYVRAAAIVLADFTQGGLAIDTIPGNLSPLVTVADSEAPLTAMADLPIMIEYQVLQGRPDLQG